MTGYGTTARMMHWIVAILVLAMVPAGGIMVQEGLDRAVQDRLFIFHKNMGVVILLLMLVRLGWRFLNPPPALPDSVPPATARIAGLAHAALYALVIFMAVTGYVRVTMGGFPIEGLSALGLHPLLPRNDAVSEMAKTAHFYGRFALLAVIALHVGAALYHLIVKRDGVFQRMWPPVARRR
jgi:cytochrome b561